MRPLQELLEMCVCIVRTAGRGTTRPDAYKKLGPLALIGSRIKLMRHWADRIDHWLDPKKVMQIKGGALA